MLNLERQNKILNYLKEKRSASTDALCKLFYASGATIRRDLNNLARDGLIKRTYGGAVYIEGSNTDAHISFRESENVNAKQKIAKLASTLINEGETLFIDSSSTALAIVPHLNKFENLTIITNGIKTAINLAENTKTNVFCTGGKLKESSKSLIGVQAKEFVSQYYADTCIISCRGLDISKGITDTNEEDVQIKKEMIKRANQVILLVDSTKIDKSFFCQICTFENINVVITDKLLDEKYLNLFEAKKIAVYHN